MPRKTLAAVAAFFALVFGVRFLPWFGWVHAPGADVLAGAFSIPDVQFVKPLPQPDPPKPPGPLDPASLQFPAGPGLIDVAGSMTRFYEGLLRCDRKEPGARVRVLHYGDSPTTADSVTSDVRQLLQLQFGDGGHGFVLLDRPWAWYGHRGVNIRASGWRKEPASEAGRAHDRRHGLGGVSFRANADATSTLEFSSRGHRTVEVQYLRTPGGGEFAIETGDGRPLLTVNTAGERDESGFAVTALPPDAGAVHLSVTRGAVRLFGVWVEKETTGVVYASLGMNGASAQTLLRTFEPAHWREQIQRQRPDLIVLNYGSNESDFAQYVDTLYAAELRELIDRVRAAAPKSSILIMSPMDRGVREPGGGIVTVPALERVVKIQQKVAAEAGVAFFNTFEAMGGAGTMARWYNGAPRLVSADFLHPMPAGAARVGSLLDQALLAGYYRWKAARR